MFLSGRRRRPVLGTALVVGASRAAARSEVAKQESRNREVQLAADMEYERQRREEEERKRKTQLAIDEAILKERTRVEEIESEKRKANAGETARVEHTGNMTGLKADQKVGTAVRFCAECGNGCKLGDKFCSKCGCNRPTADAEQKMMKEGRA